MSLENPSVIRVVDKLKELGIGADVVHLADSARSAQEAADALPLQPAGRGRRRTMTAEEAIEYGLADAIVKKL